MITEVLQLKERYLFSVWSERLANQMQNSPGFRQNGRELHFNLKLPNNKYGKGIEGVRKL